MSDSDILRKLQDQILILQINRTGKKNALTHTMYSRLADELRQADQNPDVRCALITGSEDCFTSGNDLSDFMASPPSSFEAAPVAHFLHALHDFGKPLVAAVNGVAIGIGTTLLLHCDLVYAGTNAKFQMPFVNLGLCPEGGSSYLLPRMLGHARAAELLLLGKTFDAQTAFRYGLINEVLEPAQTLDQALCSARALAAQPPAAVRLSKQLLKRENDQALINTLMHEGEHFFERLRSPEAKEAFAAFAEKRPADFSRFN